MESAVFQTSLIAAFIAGIVALFAPCCISFLLPAYLGSVFKEKEKIIFMTLIFALGIFIVMLPAVLGVAALSKALFVHHNDLYGFGGIAMLIVAFLTFFGIKLPMPRLTKSKTHADPLSIFILGIFSGITSACCAPVLVGILTLTFLSPNFFGAIAIGVSYVAGMVFPLLIISIFLAGKVEKFMFLRKSILEFNFIGKKRIITVSNFLASFIFFLTGFIILFLNSTGRLSMGSVGKFTKIIGDANFYVNRYVGGNLLINILFIVFLFIFIYYIVDKTRR